ncbi:hypothetical protein L1887_09015 [Cichorium endivia]|nr:hypothetical protein L1887_09015 [Cichorium endivia]
MRLVLGTLLNLANPIAFLLSAVSMLQHLDLNEKADQIQDAILKTIAEGKYRTRDLVFRRYEMSKRFPTGIFSTSSKARSATVLSNSSRKLGCDQWWDFIRQRIKYEQYNQRKAVVKIIGATCVPFATRKWEPVFLLCIQMETQLCTLYALGAHKI